MKLLMKEIATITSWHYIRQSWWNASINYIQVIDFDDRWDPKNWILPSLSLNDIHLRQLLHNWDILLTSKWSRTIAFMYKESYWPSIASSTFFVIRLNKADILPEYLAIYLNEALKTPYFKNHFSGGTVPSIPKSVIEEYTLTIPILEKQQQIINIYQLHKEQFTIYDTLKSKKWQLINSLILS